MFELSFFCDGKVLGAVRTRFVSRVCSKVCGGVLVWPSERRGRGVCAPDGAHSRARVAYPPEADSQRSGIGRKSILIYNAVVFGCGGFGLHGRRSMRREGECHH